MKLSSSLAINLEGGSKNPIKPKICIISIILIDHLNEYKFNSEFLTNTLNVNQRETGIRKDSQNTIAKSLTIQYTKSTMFFY
jgi:hypothetical protein